MAAQNQCDRPHGLFESWRKGPATASQSYPERVPSLSSSEDIDMDVSASDPQVLRSPIVLKSSLPAGLPSPSSSFPSSSSSPSSSTRASSPSLDNIDMPSSIVSFGTYPLVAPLVLHTFEDFVRITSIERQVCSNYVCCGVHLVDFHALINHFEEKHVSVVAPNGKRIYPPERLKPAIPLPSSANNNAPPPPPLSPSSSSSSRSSSVASSPPNTPQTPASLPLGFSAPAVQVAAPAAPEVEYNPYMGLALSVPPSTVPPNQRFQEYSDVISAFGPEYDFSKDYACYEQAYAERIHRLHEREQKEKEERERADETRRIKVEQSFTSSLSPQEEEEGMSDDSNIVPSPHQLDSDSPSFSQKPQALLAIASSSTTTKKTKGSQKVRREGSETPAREGSVVASSNNGGKVVKPKLKLASTSNGAAGGNPISAGGRKREKMFKCPHQGCTKSYLNPNGLKYHLEKGTCKFDDPVNGATSASDSSCATSPDGPASGSPTTESASTSTCTPPPPSASPSSSPSHPLPQSSATSDQPPISNLPVPLNSSTSYSYQYASSPIYPTLLASSNMPPSSSSSSSVAASASISPSLLVFHPTPPTGLVAPIARYPAFRSTALMMQAQGVVTAASQAPSHSTDRLSDGPGLPDHDDGAGTASAGGDRDECPYPASNSVSTTTISSLTTAGTTTSVPGPDHLPIVVDRFVQGDGDGGRVEAAQAQSRFLHVLRGHGQVSSSL